ncbi:hypothetical protein [Thermococcus sp. AM4]|uniref:hypothetical protein n=1 Tax=Thermococcus sp. (strain AM4) TaxID=246969 RepID=UPI0001870E5B|nr:hypothetical protein [Thermococcus sp. AM4]EEB74326.1 conserved hypothetical protein [Thermococcus sp. AM4]
MKTTNVVIAMGYGIILFLSIPYFILAGSAIVDYLGIDKHLPFSLTPIVVAFVSSVLYTALSSMPLMFTKRRDIRKAVFTLFLASFILYLIIVLFFLGFK